MSDKTETDILARVIVLEEKINQLLGYQRSARRWAIFRAVLWVIFVAVFVVLPLVGSVYLFNYLKTAGLADFGALQQQFELLQGQLGEFNRAFGGGR